MKPLKNLHEGKEYIGSRFEVTKNISGHKVPIGETITLFTVGMHGSSIVFYPKEYDTVLKHSEINPIDSTLSSMEKDLENLETYYKEKKEELTSKIDYLKAKGLDVFDKNDYKVYKILQDINNTSDESEKEKLLKSLTK